MTAPFAPVLVSPANRASAVYTAVSLKFKYIAFDPGSAMATYSIRRKQLAPTPGAYEYWTGAAWGAATWVSLAAADGAEVTIAAGAFVQNATYEWGVQTRNAALEASAWSDARLLFTPAAPTVTVSITTPAVVSRPPFSWAFAGGTGRSQLAYRFICYTAAEVAKPGFAAGAAGFTALWDSGMVFGGKTFSAKIDADLPSSGSYQLWGMVRDDTNLDSGWANRASFTTSFTPPPSPALTATPFPDLGHVSVLASSTFNLLNADTSGFDAGIGAWGTLPENCVPTWDPAGLMKVTFSGQSYAQLDANYATFALEDTAFATFAAMSADQGGLSFSAVRTAEGTSGVPVTATTVYSATATVTAQSRTVPCQLEIYWYTGAGAYISTSSGGVINCLATVPTNVYIDSATAPGTAAFAALRLRFNSPGNVIGEYVNADKFAFTATATATWSSGGASAGTGFVFQRSIDQGDWVELPGATSAEPAGATGAGLDRFTYLDRTVPLNTADLRYRVFAVGNFKTVPISSSPAIVTVTGGIQSARAFLRSSVDAAKDLRVYLSDWSWSDARRNEVVFPVGGTKALIFNQTLPPNTTANVSLTLITASDREKFQALVAEEAKLFLQMNVGPGYYVRPIGAVNYSQRRSAGPNGIPSDVHSVSFQAQVNV